MQTSHQQASVLIREMLNNQGRLGSLHECRSCHNIGAASTMSYRRVLIHVTSTLLVVPYGSDPLRTVDANSTSSSASSLSSTVHGLSRPALSVVHYDKLRPPSALGRFVALCISRYGESKIIHPCAEAFSPRAHGLRFVKGSFSEHRSLILSTRLEGQGW